MTDIEIDLYITQVEGRILKQTVKDQEVIIENQKKHIAALQTVIDNLRKRCEESEGCVDDG